MPKASTIVAILSHALNLILFVLLIAAVALRSPL